jgi:hypothetical protein
MTHHCALLIACPPAYRNRAAWVFRTWATRYDVALTAVERVGDASDKQHLIVYGNASEILRPALIIPCEPGVTKQPFEPRRTRWVDHSRRPALDLSGSASLPIVSADPATSAVRIGMDIVSSAFVFLSGLSEEAPSRRDHHGRIPHEETLVGRLGATHRPVVDEWFDLLSDGLALLVGSPVSRRDLWHGAPFAVCLTHDVDRIHRGWVDALRRGYGLVSGGRWREAARLYADAAWRLAAGADFYWNLDDILDVDRRYGGAATFYLMASTSHPLDADYRLRGRRWQDAVRRIADAGCEIGLHGSYASHCDAEMLGRERDVLERLTGEPVTGVRQHFLRFDSMRTWKAHAQAGFATDSTFGFVEEIGFRAGTAFPYQVYDAEADRPLPLVELPLVVMDRALERHLALSPDRAWPALEPVLGAVERRGGCLVVLWHNLFLAEACYPGWGALYERILDWARARSAWLASGERISHALTRPTST